MKQLNIQLIPICRARLYMPHCTSHPLPPPCTKKRHISKTIFHCAQKSSGFNVSSEPGVEACMVIAQNELLLVFSKSLIWNSKRKGQRINWALVCEGGCLKFNRSSYNMMEPAIDWFYKHNYQALQNKNLAKLGSGSGNRLDHMVAEVPYGTDAQTVAILGIGQYSGDGRSSLYFISFM